MKFSGPEMHRRQFVGTCPAAARAAGVAPPFSAGVAMSGAIDSPVSASTALFSVMLWSVDPKLPFDQDVSEVADAGDHAIELIGEWGWSRDGFTRARRQLHRLGSVVDACRGIDASLSDPSLRDAVLPQIRTILPEFECACLILLTGNQVSGVGHEQLHANCVESLQRVADLTDPQNMELLLENIGLEENPKYFLTSFAEIYLTEDRALAVRNASGEFTHAAA